MFKNVNDTCGFVFTLLSHFNLKSISLTSLYRHNALRLMSKASEIQSTDQCVIKIYVYRHYTVYKLMPTHTQSSINVQFSSVQFKMVSMHSGRPICAPPHLSGVSPCLCAQEGPYALHPVCRGFPQCCL